MLPFDRLIVLDKNSSKPVYQQIASTISQAIRNGILKPGSTLPSSRELARMLEIHRKTVIAAYDELQAQDWIAIIPRKKTIVAENIPILPAKKWDRTPAVLPYENTMSLPFKTTALKTIQSASKASSITIDDGRPDIRISPIDLLLKNYRSLLQRRFTTADIEQNMAQGSMALRSELVTYLGESRGLNVSASNIMITHGAQMSIYLCAQLLLDTPVSVVVGNPNYPMANSAFKQLGSRVIEITVDHSGIDTDLLEKLCKTQPIGVVYVIPHHHYPTTVTLSVERRMKLLALSKRYAFVIIEDDYDYDYHYNTSPYLPLASAQHQGNIIYIGSFSKILDPSLRIGFMIAATNFIEQAVGFRKMIDIGGDGYMQDALAVLIREGELQRHLKKAKKTYQRRKEVLNDLLNEHLKPYIRFQNPSGGMAIWICVHSGISLPTVQQLALQNGLKINDIDPKNNAFRFGFASLNEKELERAVLILKKCFSTTMTALPQSI